MTVAPPPAATGPRFDTAFARKLAWTAGGFLGSSGIRFALNVVLARLLAPGILGVMVVVNAVRLGVELLTDVGIEQNVVHHADGLSPDFRATAWTMQALRGLLLSLVFAAAAPWLARAYGIDVRIFLLAAISPMLGGLHSIAVFALVKRLDVARRNRFELTSEALGMAVTLALAWVLRSVWAPVLGMVFSVAIRSALSYRLPDSRHGVGLDPAIRRRIVAFGKWIAISSLLMYGATNLDRLYLGRAVSLPLLGVYGIARAIADLPTSLARRVGYQIIFPAIASAAAADGGAQGAQIARARGGFAIAACAALGAGAMVADRAVALVYDPRYQAAGAILAVLLLGSVFAILSNLNEAAVLGAGRPGLSSMANAVRAATLALALPVGLAMGSFAGAVIAVAAVEICQYGYMAVASGRVGHNHWAQDGAALAGAAAAAVLVLAIRHAAGLGTPFAGMIGR